MTGTTDDPKKPTDPELESIRPPTGASEEELERYLRLLEIVQRLLKAKRDALPEGATLLDVEKAEVIAMAYIANAMLFVGIDGIETRHRWDTRKEQKALLLVPSDNNRVITHSLEADAHIIFTTSLREQDAVNTDCEEAMTLLASASEHQRPIWILASEPVILNLLRRLGFNSSTELTLNAAIDFLGVAGNILPIHDGKLSMETP